MNGDEDEEKINLTKNLKGFTRVDLLAKKNTDDF